MPDPLEQVLRLVSDGRLTAAEAAPILDALAAANAETDDPAPGPADPAEPGVTGEPGERVQGPAPSSIRIEVKENGRQVVNLRIPVSLGRFAVDRIPGLSESAADLVRSALAAGRHGNLLVVDEEDGDGVRIALE
ncbi:MAG TPA: hypothetical protein VID95_02000 [Candidatus Limnocylindrales bacterium]